MKKEEYIPKSFFLRPSEEVAPLLIGCRIQTKSPQGRKVISTIVETEAYAPGDPACHAYINKTRRNTPMFMDGGTLYIYKIYGIHLCLNIVTEKIEIPSAVLIRAVEIDEANLLKLNLQPEMKRAGAGPGKLCKTLVITQELNGKSIFGNDEFSVLPRTRELNQILKEGNSIIQTTRIGISRGMEIPWRWYLRNSNSVSIRDRIAEKKLYDLG